MTSFLTVLWRLLMGLFSSAQRPYRRSRKSFRLGDGFMVLEDRIALDDNSAGSFGIDARGLTTVGGTALDGSSVAIGMVERGRPGMPGTGFPNSDTIPAHGHSDVVPAAVFLRNLPNNHAPTWNQDVQDHLGHAEQVAGVVIASGAFYTSGGGMAQHTGIAANAQLFAMAAATTGTEAQQHDQLLTSMQHIALQNGGSVSAINMSYSTSGVPNGESLVTLGLDWSAKVHDVLYVSARGNAGQAVVLPKDAYNGLNVASTKTVLTNGNQVFRQVVAGVGINADDPARRLTHLVAPGHQILMPPVGGGAYIANNGTSFAAPHAAGTVALLQQYANERIGAAAPGWSASAQRHEVMKAILMNSADKLQDTSGNHRLLDMTKTILMQDGSSTWSNSDARDSRDNPGGSSLPLDNEMGTGQLNAKRALKQFDPGESSHGAADVPLIGWAYDSFGDLPAAHKYPLAGHLLGTSYISATLTWDREVSLDVADGVYASGDTFAASQVADLDLYLMKKGTDDADFMNYVWKSNSAHENVEHFFFELPSMDEEYELWVMNNANSSAPAPDYALAWWATPGQAPPTQAGAVGDRVWKDFNTDGIQDAGEPGFDNVNVDLFSATGVWIATTWTDATGNYQFDNVAPGNYYLKFKGPVDYGFTFLDAGGNDALDNDANGVGITAPFTVGTSAITHVDAGLITGNWVSVGDRVWRDNDQDGIQDAGESGVEGAVVYLYGSQGGLMDVTTTDVNGLYSFTDVEPGDYYVKFELPWGYKAFSPKDAGGNDALDSDANSSGQTVTFSLASGANNTSIDCGLIDNASPVAANDTAYVVHDRTLNVSAPGLLSNDTDTESDSLHAELVSDPTYGAVDLYSDGSYSYIPQSAWTGVDTFTYRVWDGYQWSNTATVTVNVTNVQPSTSANSYVTPSSGPLVVAAPGVLGNDGNSDGDTLTAVLVTNVSQGTLSFNSNGGFTYTKPSGFSGVVFFSYKAFDGVAYSITTTVGITVSPSFLTLDGDAADAGRGSPDPAPVTKEQVRDLMHEAIARWHDAGADRQELRERWQDLNLHVFDLPDNRLAAQAGDDIVIDSNAAGHGWFVDETAANDGEFPIFVADTERRSEEPGADATATVDLLAALMHEAGHWLGLPHYEPGNHPHNVMLDTLPHSTRRVPAGGQGDVQPFEVKHFARSRPLTPALSPRRRGRGDRGGTRRGSASLQTSAAHPHRRGVLG